MIEFLVKTPSPNLELFCSVMGNWYVPGAPGIPLGITTGAVMGDTNILLIPGSVLNVKLVAVRVTNVLLVKVI